MVRGGREASDRTGVQVKGCTSYRSSTVVQKVLGAKSNGAKGVERRTHGHCFLPYGMCSVNPTSGMRLMSSFQRCIIGKRKQCFVQCISSSTSMNYLMESSWRCCCLLYLVYGCQPENITFTWWPKFRLWTAEQRNTNKKRVWQHTLLPPPTLLVRKHNKIKHNTRRIQQEEQK